MIEISLAICSSMRSDQLVCIYVDFRSNIPWFGPSYTQNEYFSNEKGRTDSHKLRGHSTVATFEQDWLKTHDRSDRSAGHAIGTGTVPVGVSYILQLFSSEIVWKF